MLKHSALVSNLLAMEPPKKNNVLKHIHFFRFPLLRAFLLKQVFKPFRSLPEGNKNGNYMKGEVDCSSLADDNVHQPGFTSQTASFSSCRSGIFIRILHKIPDLETIAARLGCGVYGKLAAVNGKAVIARYEAIQLPQRRNKTPWQSIFQRALIITALLFPITTHAAYNDASIKAAFIYRLLHFIEFPKHGITSHNSFNICTLGKSPFKYMRTAFEQRQFENKLITLVQKQKGESLSLCDVVYIAESEKAYMDDIVEPLTSQGILTISDISQFAKYGGMIGFAEYNNTLHLEINTKALEAAQFQIDPHLLEVSLNVY